MEALASKIELTSLRKAPQKVDEDVIVGKDVLELFAGAMYADPLAIFREYVQNAADAIDDARALGHAENSEADISIFFNQGERSVRIRDFGAGVPNNDFVRRLTSIGASRKRGTKARGFRGVGRLSGLGYCQELVFRSRAAGDAKVKEMRWDGRVLRERLRDQSFKGSLTELIREVAQVSELPGAEYPAHFYEVELVKILRVRNDILLNEAAVRGYLSEVAPVPFDPDFRFGEDIQTFLTRHGLPKPVRIVLSDRPGYVYHRARNTFPLSPKVQEEFRAVSYFEYQNSNGEALAFGWLLDHAYAGSIHRRLGLGGVRLRHGNVQVGDAEVLAHLFVEPRFANWAVGDVHVAHPRIIPNGRRDEFEHTPAYSQLHDELRQLVKTITQTIRERSDRRTKLKKIQAQLTIAEAWLDQTKKAKAATVAVAMLERAATHVVEARRIAAKLGAESPDAQLADTQIGRVAELVEKLAKGRKKASEGDVHYAAVSAILASSSKVDMVSELAEQVITAMKAAAKAKAKAA